jgi:hypothetical protein
MSQFDLWEDSLNIWKTVKESTENNQNAFNSGTFFLILSKIYFTFSSNIFLCNLDYFIEYDEQSSPSLPKKSQKENQSHQIHFIDSAPRKEVSITERALQNYTKQCCKEQCSWQIPLDDCIKAHRFFSHLPHPESRNWLKQ